MLHGEPGTGKTYYFRHLLSEIAPKQKVIYIPPYLVEMISQPRFVDFLTEEKGAILMIEDAVVGSINGTAFSATVQAAMVDKSVYVLGANLAARGLEGKVMDGVTVVDYAGFVDLTVTHDPIQSWL